MVEDEFGEVCYICKNPKLEPIVCMDCFHNNLLIGRKQGAVQELENLIDLNDTAWLDSHGELKSDLNSRSCYAGYSKYLAEILNKRLKELEEPVWIKGSVNDLRKAVGLKAKKELEVVK
jgi:hypothetical protein